MNHQETLRELIRTLRAEIGLGPVNKEDGATAASLKRRRELQHKLEIAHHTLAELEELDRVEEVKRQALESGLCVVAEHLLAPGECPVCLEEMPSCRLNDTPKPFKRYCCCGVICCNSCTTKQAENYERYLDEYDSSPQIEKERPMQCPFCRADLPTHDGEAYAMELRHAKAGKSWAQSIIGQRFLNGNGVPFDFDRAIHWLTLAADQGELDANATLGFVLSEDDSGDPTETALKYIMFAARNGHATAQGLCANLEGKRRNKSNSMIWFTLSAAQGHPDGQRFWGDWYNTNTLYGANTLGNDDQDQFKALYWYRKAALQGQMDAQVGAARTLKAIKESLFDGSCNRVGYSAVPEIAFWNRMACNDEADFESRCGCCGHQGDVKRCLSCKAIGYCSKECQVKHWKKGHKTDCKRATELLKAVKPFVHNAFYR